MIGTLTGNKGTGSGVTPSGQVARGTPLGCSGAADDADRQIADLKKQLAPKCDTCKSKKRCSLQKFIRDAARAGLILKAESCKAYKEQEATA